MLSVKFCVLFAIFVGVIEIVSFIKKRINGRDVDKHDKIKCIISVVGIASLCVVLLL